MDVFTVIILDNAADQRGAAAFTSLDMAEAAIEDYGRRNRHSFDLVAVSEVNGRASRAYHSTDGMVKAAVFQLEVQGL